MAEKQKPLKQQVRPDRKKVQFIVRREFSGQQTMQEAFEKLIERQAYGHFEDWLERKAS